MSESSLSLAYDDLMNSVSYFLYGKSDHIKLNSSQSGVVNDVVQSGYRQFLYPPVAAGIPLGYEWSFLRPVTTISTVASDADQDLPDDFGRLIDGFVFASGSQYIPILSDVGEGRIRRRRAQDNQTGRPTLAAIRIKSGTGSVGQRKEVMWWPTPDAVYTVSYRYEAFTSMLDSEIYKYPLGAMKHGETLKASCLAVAETKGNDERGIHWEKFIGLLASSIARDRREGQKFFGNVGCRGTYDSLRSDVSDYPYTLTVSDVIIQS